MCSAERIDLVWYVYTSRINKTPMEFSDRLGINLGLMGSSGVGDAQEQEIQTSCSSEHRCSKQGVPSPPEGLSPSLPQPKPWLLGAGVTMLWHSCQELAVPASGHSDGMDPFLLKSCARI